MPAAATEEDEETEPAEEGAAGLRDGVELNALYPLGFCAKVVLSPRAIWNSYDCAAASTVRSIFAVIGIVARVVGVLLVVIFPMEPTGLKLPPSFAAKTR